MGTNALARLDRDVLAQPKIRTLILVLGINDIAWPATPFAPNAPPMTFERLAAAIGRLPNGRAPTAYTSLGRR